MRPRIAIVGAGVGGLAAALACQRNHFDVQLFDHAEHPLTGGAALTLWPNALISLQRLGLFQHLPSWMHSLEQGQLRTHRDAVLYELPLQWMKESYGFWPTCVLRSDLTQYLHEALGEPTIRSAHCERISSVGDEIAVHLADGTVETCNGVIAADGIHSPIRRHLVGDIERTVHYIAWRGIATGHDLPERSMAEYWGAGVRFGYAAISPSSTYWFATVNKHLLASEEMDDWPDAARQLRGFPPFVQRCIEATPIEAITPNLGFGACLALEDASALAGILATGGSISQGFQRYARQLKRFKLCVMHLSVVQSLSDAYCKPIEGCPGSVTHLTGTSYGR